MANIILISILAAAISGSSSYFLSYLFNSGNAAQQRSSKFGNHSRSFLDTFAGTYTGILIGVLALFAARHLPAFPAEAAEPASITTMLSGAAAGIIGMMRGQAAREWGPRDNG